MTTVNMMLFYGGLALGSLLFLVAVFFFFFFWIPGVVRYLSRTRSKGLAKAPGNDAVSQENSEGEAAGSQKQGAAIWDVVTGGTQLDLNLGLEEIGIPGMPAGWEMWENSLTADSTDILPER